jgi:hypothetical protein
MAQPPINIFTRNCDPAGVATFLRDRAPGATFDADGDEWREAVVTFGKGKSKRTVSFSHDPDYYGEPEWSKQMSGMWGYFASFPDSPRKESALMLTTTFRFAVSVAFEPDYDFATDDPRLALLYDVAKFLDGVLFVPGAMLDASGRVLYGADSPEEEEPAAEWPKVRGSVSMSSPAGEWMHEKSRPRTAEEGPYEDAEPPTAERVARRALALAAVTGRAILEQDDPKSKETKSTYADLVAWVKEVGIDDEFEPEEREVVKRKPGKLDQRQQIDSTWRLEGLAVLAWALKKFDIPAHDELVQVSPLLRSVGILDADAARALLAKPELRSREEIATLRNRLFALHWRLRDYSINPKAMDFAAFAQKCSFGPLNITGLPLVDGDLAIRGARIDRADEDALRAAHSTAQERHLAANWLWEGPELYSEASVAT